MRPLVLPSAVAAALTSLAAAAAPTAPPPAGAVPVPRAVAEERGVAGAAARAAREGVRWGRCTGPDAMPGTARCGTVTVPLDYARPDGPTVRLTVSRSPATGGTGTATDTGGAAVGTGTAADTGGTGGDGGATGTVPRQGALVFGAGGPGASGTAFPAVALLPEWKPLAAAYDLVGYAPRGVGRSGPLYCADPADRPAGPRRAPTRPSEAFKRERRAEAERYARDCARRGGSALRHHTSLNNARDLEVIRAALGEPRLTYLGVSYGAYLGALHADLFPHRVRRMVLDSPANPDPAGVWYRDGLDRSAAAETRWADFRAWVARHDDVHRLGGDARAVARGYERAAARLAGRPAGGTVGPGQLRAAMLTAVRFDDVWPHRARALADHLRGDDRQLLAQAGPPPDAGERAALAAAEENARAVYTAVRCNDAPWPTDWEVWDADATRLARTAPFGTWDGVWAHLPCAYWKGPRQEPRDVRTARGELPPVLILAAERDAAAPYRGALELRKRLAGAALVTERNAGSHGLAGGRNTCVRAHLRDYLLHGRLPAGGEAACAPHPEPVPRRAAGDG
ncbi:alpha/beta hydrolase [Streptomyces sp. MJP52]|uniref:alpha/beta hydrolase n=1 Tax=Streptomyces sp. MJP52 TaxID=2940555 RepID=UPI002475DB5D|nr:alpha/beta hydrolase [Streptomyces sp. MJP52]MDH6224117.1 pimeloyl-ACP methyl ester carboxylesterase [Streptomyces sp. MJP52]